MATDGSWISLRFILRPHTATSESQSLILLVLRGKQSSGYVCAAQCNCRSGCSGWRDSLTCRGGAQISRVGPAPTVFLFLLDPFFLLPLAPLTRALPTTLDRVCTAPTVHGIPCLCSRRHGQATRRGTAGRGIRPCGAAPSALRSGGILVGPVGLVYGNETASLSLPR